MIGFDKTENIVEIRERGADDKIGYFVLCFLVIMKKSKTLKLKIMKYKGYIHNPISSLCPFQFNFLCLIDTLLPVGCVKFTIKHGAL